MSLALIIILAAITIASFFLMEVVAWTSHKYIMHGVLWTWHKSHHTNHNRKLERNDLFAVVFSIPSIFLIYYSTVQTYNPYLASIGIGMMLYGMFYFIFHDVIVHQRIKWRPKRRGAYLNRIINAHYMHHRVHAKDGCEAFGFLYAPRRYGINRDKPETEGKQIQ